MKKAVIIEHGGGELANQLWNYASIYAYTLETGLKLENPSFYEYGSMFRIPHGFIEDMLLYSPFRSYRGRRDAFLPKLWRNFYKLYSKAVISTHASEVISSVNSNNDVYYLPPTKPHTQELKEREVLGKIYFSGWLFRNPQGLEKHREAIVEYFKPIEKIELEIEDFLKDARTFKHVVGVHIRQGDYKKFKDGKYWIEQTRVREIMDEYLKFSGKSKDEVCFVIASDGVIRPELFTGLNIQISFLSAIHDLFMLSKTNIILGSDSSFSDFAAYYGNIPHVVFQKNTVDWNYYFGKDTYFENTYCTMVHY